MATRNIVPRNDGEGNLGTTTKKWNGIYTNTLNGRNVDNDGKKLDETREGLTEVENGVSAIKVTVTSMNSTIINNTDAINSLKASVGSPLTAKTVAEMHDKNKIYVYTGTESGYIAGNWYYNNGATWVSGGVYNSTAFETDKSLTLANQAADAQITGDYLRLLHNNMNKVKGDYFRTGGGMVTNNRIVSKPIYAPKGTIIRLLSSKYYYDIGNGWTQTDMVIDETREITITVCKAPIDAPTPDMAFGYVDEIEDIVLCLVPENEPSAADEAIKALSKKMNKVKGDHFKTVYGDKQIVSKPICATKGTIIHLLSSKYYYDIGNGWTQEDTVIDENREITITVHKGSLNGTTRGMVFESIDEIEDSVLCLVPENEPKENKDLVRQATYSSDNNYGETLSTPVFSLLHFSDLHGDVDALNRIVNKSSEYPVDDMICTGDMVVDNSSESIKSWWEPTVLTCMGNHDCAVRTDHDGTISYDWNNLTMHERDNAYISPFEAQWGNIVHENGTSYYYKDYPTKKVRLVVVDIMLYLSRAGSTLRETESSAQTLWLEDTLQSAIDSGYHVVIATHYPLRGAKIKDCSFSPYNSDGKLFEGDAFTTILHETVDKYIQKGLHFVCYLSGHNHKDAVVYVDKTTQQIQVLIACAHTRNRGLWSYGDQYRGPDDDAINIVCVDTYHNLLKLVRISGANIDEYMRPRKAICINYTTGEVVSEVK